MNEDILGQLGQGQPDAPAEEPTEEIKYEEKKKSSGKQLDEEVLKDLLMNGDNTKGMITPSEKDRKKANDDEELHEEQDEKAKLKSKGDATPSDKYERHFQKDILKNPENYTINTPNGPMTVKEAMAQGYNPVTRRFRKSNKEVDKTLSMLNDKDRAAAERLFDPKQLGLAPADADGLGVSPTSNMVKGVGQEDPATAVPPADQQALTPQGAEMIPPTGGTPPAGGNPLEAMLGGNV